MNKTLNTILSVALYSIAGYILGDAFGSASWQFWTICVVIVGVDMLSFTRGINDGFDIMAKRSE